MQDAQTRTTYNITTFDTKNKKTKVPYSPYEDDTFIFQTHETDNISDLYSIMVRNFVLNCPLAIKKPVRTYRRKKYLEELYSTKINYFVIDIDDLKTEFDKSIVLEYFKDYKCVLGESRSYDGMTNFNLKGILCCEDMKLADLKPAIELINLELKGICNVDPSVSRKATLNAPILKRKVFLENPDGKLFHFISEDKEKLNILKDEVINDINKKVDTSIEVSEDDTIADICLKIFRNMQYEAISKNANGSVSFKHPSEKKSIGGFFWFEESPYTMHHNNSVKSFNIFDTVRKIPEAKVLLEKTLNYDNELLRYDTNNSVLQVNEKFLEVNTEIDSKIEAFLHARNGLLSIKSPMGTGKSTIINHIIKESHDLDMKVLVVTNRVSVAEDFSRKYELKIYNKDPYEIGDSLVVQFDSLWRYNIKFFDIVIMDEFISLMLHSRNNASNNPINLNKFFGCFNKKLVIADAFLTGYENFLLSNKQHNLHLIDNIYRDPTNLFSYENKNKFTDNLLARSDQMKITVSCTSLSYLNALKLLLEERGKKVITLTAETPESTKKLIYELFEKKTHDKWDVLIYSPTLTVGVSNLNDIYSHFHYDGGKSVDIISSLQMIKRTRNAKEIHVYIDSKKNYLKTDFNQMRDEYLQNIGKMNNNYLFEVDDYGETRLSDIGKKSIKIDVFKNILDFDKKAAFDWLSKYHFLYAPTKVEKSIGHDVLLKYVKLNKESEDRLKRSKIQEYLSLTNAEKYDLVQDNPDATLKKILQYDEHINATPGARIEILNKCLEDSNFIEKCKKYKHFKEYLTGESKLYDIKLKMSEAMMNNEDYDFFKMLSELNTEMLDYSNFYTPIIYNNIKGMKKILTSCGYSNGKELHGERGLKLDGDIDTYYRYII